MAQSTAENRISQNTPSRVARPAVTREQDGDKDGAKKPRRRSRANEITSAIGLTPIMGLSGPRIAY